jgi:hypothetical protein
LPVVSILFKLDVLFFIDEARLDLNANLGEILADIVFDDSHFRIASLTMKTTERASQVLLTGSLIMLLLFVVTMVVCGGRVIDSSSQLVKSGEECARADEFQPQDVVGFGRETIFPPEKY